MKCHSNVCVCLVVVLSTCHFCERTGDLWGAGRIRFCANRTPSWLPSFLSHQSVHWALPKSDGALGRIVRRVFNRVPVVMVRWFWWKGTVNNEQVNSLDGFVPNALIEDLFLSHASQKFNYRILLHWHEAFHLCSGCRLFNRACVPGMRQCSTGHASMIN